MGSVRLRNHVVSLLFPSLDCRICFVAFVICCSLSSLLSNAACPHLVYVYVSISLSSAGVGVGMMSRRFPPSLQPRQPQPSEPNQMSARSRSLQTPPGSDADEDVAGAHARVGPRGRTGEAQQAEGDELGPGMDVDAPAAGLPERARAGAAQAEQAEVQEPEPAA